MILVIFDVDGTLVYSERRDSHSFASVYERLYAKSFPTIDWHHYPHVTDTTIFNTVIRQHFNRDHTEEERLHFQRHYLDLLRQGRRSTPHLYREVPGARQAVTYLLDHGGYQVSIATGGWRQPARLKLEHVGIPAEKLYISGADGKHTREDILREAIEQAGGPGENFEKIVYIGDALWDVTTTRNLHLNFVGIRYRNDLELLQRAGASHVLANYLDLPFFLNALAEAQPPEDK